jgi:glycosyltransferase involved in cell wall biosynthesis
MASYLQIPDQKLYVVPLGIKMDDYESKTFTRSEPFTIGYFARVTPEKGLHLLAEAYRYLRQRGDLPSSRLTVAGYLGEDSRIYLQGIQRQMELEGFGDEFDYVGALNREDKIEFLGGLDVLSVPATYDEPKGIFLLEAMASGVPVVQPRRGAFPEILGLTAGGVLVEPDDKVSLAKGILSVYQDIDLATELSTSGQRGVREHYHVGLMADRTLDVFENI